MFPCTAEPPCGGLFVSDRGVNLHVRTVHGSSRDFVCQYCTADFAYANVLKRHVRTVHERRKDYSCQHCDMKFGQSSTCNTHVKRIHEGGGGTICDECGKTLVCLKKHQERCVGGKYAHLRCVASNTTAYGAENHLERCSKRRRDGARTCGLHKLWSGEALQGNHCFCMNVTQGGPTDSFLLCGHEFHSQCIYQWGKRDTSCPVCRAQFQHHFYKSGKRDSATKRWPRRSAMYKMAQQGLAPAYLDDGYASDEDCAICMQGNLLWLHENNTNADMLRCESCSEVTHVYCAGFGPFPLNPHVPGPDDAPWLCATCDAAKNKPKSKKAKKAKKRR
jgi:hypothetical protein